MKNIVTYHSTILSVVIFLFVGMFGNALLLSTDMLFDFIPETLENCDIFDSNETEDDQVEEDAENKLVATSDVLKFQKVNKLIKTDFQYLLSLLHHKETPTPPPDFSLI